VSGSSKVLLVCGFCVSFGVYTSNIQEANNKVVQLGQENSYYTQARMIATAGLNHARYNMGRYNWFNTNQKSNIVTINNLLFGGDTCSYVIDKNGCSTNEARVTVNAKFSNVIARQVAMIRLKCTYSNNYMNWEIKRAYFYPYQFANY
jgi:phosphomevalonate kinase